MLLDSKADPSHELRRKPPGPDVDWLAKPSGDTPKHRVRRQQRPSLRSLERIKARHKRCLTSDRGARQEPPHPSLTAQELS